MVLVYLFCLLLFFLFLFDVPDLLPNNTNVVGTLYKSVSGSSPPPLFVVFLSFFLLVFFLIFTYLFIYFVPTFPLLL